MGKMQFFSFNVYMSKALTLAAFTYKMINNQDSYS